MSWTPTPPASASCAPGSPLPSPNTGGARDLAPLVDDAGWYRGYCPVCGGEPDMAALGKGSGRRRLLCSRCDSEWTFRRLGCPFCGDEEAGKQVHYPSDDHVYRLSVCEDCRRYVK